jgi:hypothetical protein
VSEKEALQKAADEARKVARAAREFAGVLDDYAKYLTQPTWRVRANESRLSALNRLAAINNGMAALAACNDWIEESSETSTTQSIEEPITSEVVTEHNGQQRNHRRSVKIEKRGNIK